MERHSSRALGLLLVLGMLAPLLIAGFWGDVYADTAYRQFQQARAIARGAERSWDGFSPLYTLMLALADRLRAALPSVATTVSVLGWIAALASWFWTGLALGQPTFSIAAVFLLALHPLQPQVLGLESGAVLGIWGVATLLAVRGRRAATLIAMIALVAAQPMTLPLIVPLFVYSQVWRRSSPALVHVTISVSVGVAGYALLCALAGECSEPRQLAVLLGALQLLFAAGFARLVPDFDWLVRPLSDTRALQRGTASICLLVLALWQGNTLLQGWNMRPVDRLALYKAVGRWLYDNTLANETIGTQMPGLLGYLSDRSALVLPDTTQASALLEALDRARPDYCVTLDSLVWHGVQSNPWFRQRYRETYQLVSPHDSATPVTVFRHNRSPFDDGEIIRVAARFTPDAQEWIELTDYRLDERRITPGEPLHLTLNWRAATAIRQPLFLVMRLISAATGEVWVQTENQTPGGLATDLWNPQTRLADQYALLPPPDLPPGEYKLDVAFYPRNDATVPVFAGGQGEALRREPLTLILAYRVPDISSAPLTPDHPLRLTFEDGIELIGYDLPKSVAPGETLRVALYWHAQRSVALDYKVFVHLFAPDGQLLAQDDSVPVNWTYPTTRWQAGEYIRDEHLLAIDPAAPRGDYALSVGLYDTVSGERVVVRDVKGSEVAERRVVLRQVQIR